MSKALRDALTKAAEQFDRYAHEHRGKAAMCPEVGPGSDGRRTSNAKADTNDAMAKMCRDALAAANTPDYVLGYHEALVAAESVARLDSAAHDALYQSTTDELQKDRCGARSRAALELADKIRIMPFAGDHDRIPADCGEQNAAWSFANSMKNSAVGGLGLLCRAFLRLHGDRPTWTKTGDGWIVRAIEVINNGRDVTHHPLSAPPLKPGSGDGLKKCCLTPADEPHALGCVVMVQANPLKELTDKMHDSDFVKALTVARGTLALSAGFPRGSLDTLAECFIQIYTFGTPFSPGTSIQLVAWVKYQTVRFVGSTKTMDIPTEVMIGDEKPVGDGWVALWRKLP